MSWRSKHGSPERKHGVGLHGQWHKNTAIGKNNTAASILGSANKTHVFGRNSAATVTGLNNQTIKVKDNNKTSSAP